MNPTQQQIIENCHFNIYNKLPKAVKNLYGPEDIKQELCAYFLSSPKLRKMEKPIEIATTIKYFSKAFIYTATDRLCKEQEYFVSHIGVGFEAASQMTEHGMETIMVDLDNPETLYEQKQDKKNYWFNREKLVQEVKRLCQQFSVPYHDGKLIQSLSDLLKRTLVEYTPQQFQDIPSHHQDRLKQLADMMHFNNLKIQGDDFYHSKGLRHVIYNFMKEQGPTCNTKMVKHYLIDQGYITKTESIAVMVSQLRKQLGYPNLHHLGNNLWDKVQEGMIQMGIKDIKSMRTWLTQQDIEWRENTLSQYMSTIRKQQKNEQKV